MTAWQWILPEVIVKCSKKCHKSNVVDGADDDMLWNAGEDGGNINTLSPASI